MDIAEQTARTNLVKDQVGERCQKLFQDFLDEYVLVYLDLDSKSDYLLLSIFYFVLHRKGDS